MEWRRTERVSNWIAGPRIWQAQSSPGSRYAWAWIWVGVVLNGGPLMDGGCAFRGDLLLSALIATNLHFNTKDNTINTA